MIIELTRIFETKAPFDLLAENGNDWTHFVHLHRKSHDGFRLLHKEANREIFLYRARLIPLLPIFIHYIVFREYLPAQNGYRQCYLNVRSGRVSWLNAMNLRHPDRSEARSEFRFNISNIWRFFPGVWSWLFNRRMNAVTDEDMDAIQERVRIGGWDNPKCAPEVPERFDLLDDLLRQPFSTPDKGIVTRVSDARGYRNADGTMDLKSAAMESATTQTLKR